jgi:hypothetical protein
MDAQKIYRSRTLNTTHIIKQQVFDVSFGSRDNAHKLQDELSALYRRELLPLIEALFTASAAGRSISIDTLEIDLGDIDYRNMSEELAEALKEKLKKELEKHVPPVAAAKRSRRSINSHDNGREKKTKKTELLEHFLLYGSFPWWMGSSAQPAADEILAAAIAADASSVIAVLKRAGKRSWVRKRLAHRFSDGSLGRLVHLLEPRHAQFIIDYAFGLQELHEEKPAAEAGAQEFRAAKWEFVFTYLLVERGSVFNTRAFVKSTVAQLAARFNISYGELIAFLAAAVKDVNIPFSLKSSLPSLLAGLNKEHEEMQPAEDNEEIGSKEARSSLVTLSYYLLHGSLPAHAHEVTRSAIFQLVHASFANEKDELVKIIMEAGKKPGVPARIAFQLPEPLIIKIIHALEPSSANFIIDYAQGLQKLHEKKQIVKANAAEFRKVKWEMMLTHLFVERGSYFNTRVFVQSIIRQLAARYSIRYSELLIFLGAAIKTADIPVSLRQTLPAIIRSLGEEQLAEEDKKEIEHKHARERSEVAVMQRDALGFFFRYGRLPWWYKETFFRTPAQLSLSLVSIEPSEVALALRKAGAHAARHIATAYPERLVHRIIYILEPVHGKDIVSYMRSAQQLHKQDRITAVQPTVFNTILTEVTLTFLLADRGSYFNTKTYLRYTIQKLAARFNMKYESLLQKMQAVITLIPAAGRFAQVITELGEEDNEDAAGKSIEEETGGESVSVFASAEEIGEWMNAGEERVPGSTNEPDHAELKDIEQFLLYGTWTGMNASYPLEELIKHLSKSEPELFRMRIARLLRNPSARQRMVQLLSVTRLHEMISMLAGAEIAYLSYFMKDIEIVLAEYSVYYSRDNSNRYRQLIMEFVLGIAAFSYTNSGSKGLTEKQFAAAILQLLAHHEKLSLQQFFQVFDSMLKRVVPELVSKLPLVVSSLRTEMAALEKKNTEDKAVRQKAKEREKQKKEDAERAKKKKDPFLEQEEPADAIYINNAGLVLFGPYLSRYFEMLDLVYNRKFRNDAAASRGVHLLQYLVNGKEEDTGEQSLVLNKLLCGLPTWWPVQEFPALTDKERETTSQMLGAVIRNWPAAKNTSPAAFRETFLDRSGRLAHKDTSWRLKVEKRTYDVLLAQLPWSFNNIKLPWMEKIIYTEWK